MVRSLMLKLIVSLGPSFAVFSLLGDTMLIEFFCNVVHGIGVSINESCPCLRNCLPDKRVALCALSSGFTNRPLWTARAYGTPRLFYIYCQHGFDLEIELLKLELIEQFLCVSSRNHALRSITTSAACFDASRILAESSLSFTV